MSALLGAGRIASALDLPSPTPEQVAVIEHPLTSMLVVAGAGSGKTETMASRVVWLVANHLVRPEDVLGLTFTRKASGELAERITRRLRHLARSGLWTPEPVGGDLQDEPSAEETGPWQGRARSGPGAGGPAGDPVVLAPTVSTYHAYAGRLVRDHGLLLGVESDSRLLTEAGAWQLAHEAVVTYDEPIDGLDAAESTVTAAVLALSAELAEHLRDVDDVEAVLAQLTTQIESKPLGGRRRGVPAQVAALLAHARQQRALLPLVRRYAELKRRRDCVDFADQMALAARLAMTCPDVAWSERARHRLVLLDEFQDTSEAQMSFLHALFAAEGARPGPDASAASGVMSGAMPVVRPRELGESVPTSIAPGSVLPGSVLPGPAVPVMAVGDPHQSIYGWRGASATTLGGFARRFGTDGSTPTLQLSTSWRNDETVLQVANIAAQPLSRASTVPVARLVPAPGAARGAVSVLRAETMRDEAEAVAGWIAARWSPQGATVGSRGRTAAVLCRRRAQFPAVVDALRERGVPVEVVGVGGLLLTPEVADLHALLAVAGDPARGDMLMRLLTGPAARLGAADLDGLAAWARHLHRAALAPLAGSSTDRIAQAEPTEPTDATDLADPAAPESTAASAGAREDGGGPHVGRTEVHDLPSIVEAIGMLPPPQWHGSQGEGLSPTGRRRLLDLAEAIAQVRRVLGAPLVDIVRVAEESLGLDVEVLARPDIPWAAARVHLDAFLDVAADFEAAADRPTLEGFLAWLEAAKEQERGLESPASHTSEDAVQVLTVHAAKGLEWDVVAVPGLVDASFPSFRCGPTLARNGAWASTQPKDRGWTTGLDRIPYSLRGDVAGLPALSWADAPDLDDLERRLEDFAQAGGEHAIAEERRLAYVALTRARHELLLSASVWTEAASPRITSRFLTEILETAGSLDVLEWVPMPPADGTAVVNPATAQGAMILWPTPADVPSGRETGANIEIDIDIESAGPGHRSDLDGTVSGAVPRAPSGDGQDEAEVDEPLDLSEISAEIDVLLAARARDPRGDAGAPQPAHLSASELVRFAADPQAFLLQLRRPVPQRPSPAARRGTLLHRWIEEHFAHASIVDVDDLPGFIDATDEDDEDGALLQARKERFLASAWANRTPRALELPVETVVDGISLRGRIDAVFDEPDGGVVIVDWKNASPPTGRALRARSLQLSVYRLAYARLTDRPLSEVDAVFYFAETGETLRPDLSAAVESEISAHLAALQDALDTASQAGGSGLPRRSTGPRSRQEEDDSAASAAARPARAPARSEADSTPESAATGGSVRLAPPVEWGDSAVQSGAPPVESDSASGATSTSESGTGADSETSSVPGDAMLGAGVPLPVVEAEERAAEPAAEEAGGSDTKSDSRRSSDSRGPSESRALSDSRTLSGSRTMSTGPVVASDGSGHATGES